MEKNESSKQYQRSDGWKIYDAVPRAGPWLFIVVAEAWDRGEVHGAWVRASASTSEVVQVIAAAVGQRHEPTALTVVDQVGLDGPAQDIY